MRVKANKNRIKILMKKSLKYRTADKLWHVKL